MFLPLSLWPLTVVSISLRLTSALICAVHLLNVDHHQADADACDPQEQQNEGLLQATAATCFAHVAAAGVGRQGLGFGARCRRGLSFIVLLLK